MDEVVGNFREWLRELKRESSGGSSVMDIPFMGDSRMRQGITNTEGDMPVC